MEKKAGTRVSNTSFLKLYVDIICIKDAESRASQWPGSPPQWSARLLHPQLELSPSTPSAGVFLDQFFMYSPVAILKLGARDRLCLLTGTV
jgi:hypothetical protein